MQYIIYHDKTHEKVDDKIAEVIWQKSTEGVKGVALNGKKYFFSSIAKILNEQDYFSQYPDKRPVEVVDNFTDNYGDIGNQQIRQPSTHARELMLQGFKKFYQEKLVSDDVINHKIKMFFGSKVDKELEKLAETFGGTII